MARSNSGIINTGSIGGDARVEHRSERIGDENRIEAIDSIVTTKGLASGITQRIAKSAAVDGTKRDELERLLRELLERMDRLAETQRGPSERVVEAADVLSKELAREEQSPGHLSDAWGMLKKSVDAVAACAPEAVLLVKAIAGLLGLAA